MPSRKNPEFLCESCDRSIEKNDTFCVTCPKCGKYEIVGSLASTKRDENDNLKCSVMVRRYWETNKEPLELHSGNFKQTARKYDNINLNDKMSNFLYYLAHKTKPGDFVKIDNTMHFVTPSVSEKEFVMIWKHFVDLGYVEMMNGPTFELTIEGWQYIADNDHLINPNQCFIAMSFSDPEVHNDYKTSVTEVLNDLDMEPVIMLDVEHNEDAVFEIMYHIKRSAFVIADVRGDKTNVYYEAGYAKGLGREVIWLCPEKLVKKLPFDTRNLNHIVWKTKAELKDKLRKRIMGTVLS